MQGFLIQSPFQGFWADYYTGIFLIKKFVSTDDIFQNCQDLIEK